MCFFILLGIESSAQYKFDNAIHISKEEGLPSNHVQVIKQCKNGFMWFGTTDGLCRFDGSQIKVYQQIKGQSNSLLYNRVSDVLAGDDRIWATTAVGLSVLDVYADTFVNYIYDLSGIRHNSVPRSHLQMTSIYQDKRGDIWVRDKRKWFFKIQSRRRYFRVLQISRHRSSTNFT